MYYWNTGSVDPNMITRQCAPVESKDRTFTSQGNIIFKSEGIVINTHNIAIQQGVNYSEINVNQLLLRIAALEERCKDLLDTQKDMMDIFNLQGAGVWEELAAKRKQEKEELITETDEFMKS